jgi:hypothetical protein
MRLGLRIAGVGRKFIGDQNYFTDRNLELKTYPDHQYIKAE